MILQPLRTPGDGNCLFSAVAQIVADRLTQGRGVTQDQLAGVTQFLRARVAERVLRERDAEVNETVASWYRLWRGALREKDRELMEEFKHMRNVGHPLTALDRRVLFRNMMNAGVYWGEEFALRSLERTLRCRLCVIDAAYKVIRREPAALSEEPLFVGFLFLRHQHYEPLRAVPSERLSWAPGELPEQLRGLLDMWLQHHLSVPVKHIIQPPRAKASGIARRAGTMVGSSKA